MLCPEPCHAYVSKSYSHLSKKASRKSIVSATDDDLRLLSFAGQSRDRRGEPGTSATPFSQYQFASQIWVGTTTSCDSCECARQSATCERNDRNLLYLLWKTSNPAPELSAVGRWQSQRVGILVPPPWASLQENPGCYCWRANKDAIRVSRRQGNEKKVEQQFSWSDLHITSRQSCNIWNHCLRLFRPHTPRGGCPVCWCSVCEPIANLPISYKHANLFATGYLERHSGWRQTASWCHNWNGRSDNTHFHRVGIFSMERLCGRIAGQRSRPTCTGVRWRNGKAEVSSNSIRSMAPQDQVWILPVSKKAASELTITNMHIMACQLIMQLWWVHKIGRSILSFQCNLPPVPFFFDQVCWEDVMFTNVPICPWSPTLRSAVQPRF